jgi:cytochrome c553
MRWIALRRAGTLSLATAVAAVSVAGGARSEPAASDSPTNAPGTEPPSEGARVGSAEVAGASDAATEQGAPVTPEAPPIVGDPAAGATKAAVCGGCHGPDGNAPVPQFPKLAGQRFDYIAKQLRDFKSGQRVDPVMVGMASMLSDQDIANVAAHFERGVVRVGSGDPELATTGERIYRKGRPEIGLLPCIGCHGQNGEGANGAIDGGFPAISGQNPDYLAKQLQGFRSGVRTNDWKGIMQLVASRMSNEDIAALIAYLTSLPRSPEQSWARETAAHIDGE